MNTKNKQDQKRKGQQTRQKQGPKKQGQSPNNALDDRKYQDHELPEMRLTR
ncbi:MAG: hypothetical protein ABSB35_18040 [Bryobacteraceae bacterium]|jgi:hypothetical protein